MSCLVLVRLPIPGAFSSLQLRGHELAEPPAVLCLGTFKLPASAENTDSGDSLHFVDAVGLEARTCLDVVCMAVAAKLKLQG